MTWPFRRKLTGKDATQAKQVVRHLQTQLALQQLGTETYNGGMAAATSSVNEGDGIFVRDIGTVVDPGLVKSYLLPAAEGKVSVVQSMVTEHQEFNVVQHSDKSSKARQKWTDFLTVLQARANLQLECWKDFIADSSRYLADRMTSLDRAEDESMDVALAALNDLIKRAGLEGEAWLSINWAAFNDVRSRIGLPSLTETDFREMYYRGMAGERTEFFE